MSDDLTPLLTPKMLPVDSDTDPDTSVLLIVLCSVDIIPGNSIFWTGVMTNFSDLSQVPDTEVKELNDKELLAQNRRDI